jgi:hypothetical protein
MATITDWSGKEVTGVLSDVPAKWASVNVRDAGFSHYEAGGDLIRARVEYSHKRGYWIWELYSGCRYVPVDDNEYRTPKTCTTALQAIRAVQRAARKHRVAQYF